MDINKFLQGLSAIFESGKKEQVSDYLYQSLVQAEAEKDLGASITILNELAGYLRSISKYTESIAAIEKAIQRLKDLGYENTIPYGTTLLNAATAYRASGNKEKALELFLLVFDIFKAQLPENDARLAGLLNNISSIHDEAQQYEKALDLLDQSANILKQHKNMLSDYATVQTNIAMIFLKQNRVDEAIATLESAVNLFEKDTHNGTKRADPHYAAALAGLGEVYYRKKRYQESIGFYERAIKHLESTFGQNKDYAISCRNCAVVCQAAGETAKATMYDETAKHILGAINS